MHMAIQLAEQIDSIIRGHRAQNRRRRIRGHDRNQLNRARGIHAAEYFSGGVSSHVLGHTRGNRQGKQFQRHHSFLGAEALQLIRDFARIEHFPLDLLEQFFTHVSLQFSTR